MHVLACQRTPLTLAILLAFSASAHAQNASSRLDKDPDSIPTVVISASALGLLSDDMVTPVTSLGGGELVRARESTLGETLAGQPGITSSHFGAGASRPVIRGMDGPRVKILSDGAEIQDASTISPDHAVAFEPVLAERIEVLRGPSALAYGGGAVGGVVNILDRKIPTAMPEKPLEGSVELRANSVAREKTTAFEFTGGAGNLAIHAEGVLRDADATRSAAAGKAAAAYLAATRKARRAVSVCRGSASAASSARPTPRNAANTASRATTTNSVPATRTATTCIAAATRKRVGRARKATRTTITSTSTNMAPKTSRS